MCLLIYKPKGHHIENKSLEAAWQANGDGAGVGYLLGDGTPIIDKGYFKLKPFKRILNQLDDVDCLIHFRLATHGLLDEDNCHPFAVNDSFLFAHNGILNELDEEPIRSDTRIFAEDILAGMLENQEAVSAWQKTVIEMAMGHSKGALLSQAGVVILNESAGLWDQGVWYSNKSYKPQTYRFGSSVGYRTRKDPWFGWDDEYSDLEDYEYKQALACEFSREDN